MSVQPFLQHANPVEIDGSTLEGGGQLLRIALSLSALTYSPVHITKIRANRASKASKKSAGGLKPAHLAAVKWLAGATAAETQGLVKMSRDLVFRPKPICLRDDGLGHQANTNQQQHPDSIKVLPETMQTWNPVFEGDRLVRRETHVVLNTPGSVCLILQAILPYILFSVSSIAAPASSGMSDSDTNVLLRVVIKGGTNVGMSPSIEYFSQVFIPMLVEKVGLPPIEVKLIKRGWSSGRADIGSVSFDITPLVKGARLPTFSFSDRGEVVRVHVSILAPDAHVINALKDEVNARLLEFIPNIDILFPVKEISMHSRRLYLLVVAETANGYRLGRDCLYGSKFNSTTVKEVATQVLQELQQELHHGGCVDEHMHDQLVVFQALAQGKSTVDAGSNTSASLHTKTARWVAETVLGVTFEDDGACEGIGFEVGEEFQSRKTETAEKLEERLEQLNL
ncbi:MAG: hypothetical protein LQ342_000160 [Letrouitia transgressa]|nr:MAG: hypothetical protein LQ342_000160 [Letrouitia transgressa]